MPQLAAEFSDVAVDKGLESFKHLVDGDEIVFVGVDGIEDVVGFFDSNGNVVFLGCRIYNRIHCFIGNDEIRSLASFY